MLDFAEALAQVEDQCSYASVPALTVQQVTDILTRTQRGTIWAPSTAYHFGDRVMPTVANGHHYKCVVAGTSGTVEPTWPLYSTPDLAKGITMPIWFAYGASGIAGAAWSTGVVAENLGLTWQEYGRDWDCLWDIRKATYACWLKKASLVTGAYDVNSDRQGFKRSQMYAQCLGMAKQYISTEIA